MAHIVRLAGFCLVSCHPLRFGSVVGSVHQSVCLPPPPHSDFAILYCPRPWHSSREWHHLKSLYLTTYFHVPPASWSVLTSPDPSRIKPPSMFTVLLHLSCSIIRHTHKHTHWENTTNTRTHTDSKGNAFFIECIHWSSNTSKFFVLQVTNHAILRGPLSSIHTFSISICMFAFILSHHLWQHLVIHLCEVISVAFGLHCVY